MASRRVLNSSREGDSTASLGSLSQCFVTLTVKKCLSYSAGTSCASVCARCLSSSHWAQLKRDQLHPLDTLPSDIIHIGEVSPQSSLLQAKQAQFFQPVLIQQVKVPQPGAEQRAHHGRKALWDLKKPVAALKTPGVTASVRRHLPRAA